MVEWGIDRYNEIIILSVWVYVNFPHKFKFYIRKKLIIESNSFSHINYFYKQQNKHILGYFKQRFYEAKTDNNVLWNLMFNVQYYYKL